MDSIGGFWTKTFGSSIPLINSILLNQCFEIRKGLLEGAIPLNGSVATESGPISLERQRTIVLVTDSDSL